MPRTKRRIVRRFTDLFDRSQILSTTPGQNGWTVADTSASGTPVYRTEASSGIPYLALRTVNTSEAEIVCAYLNDVLSIPFTAFRWMKFLMKAVSVDAVTTIVAGLGSARNDTPDSVATLAWVRMEGSASTTALVAETDDTATDKDDIATGITVGSDWVEVMIVRNAAGNIEFYVNGDRVAETTTFSMAAATSSTAVQPIFQVQKASGTGVPELRIAALEWECEYEW